MKDLLNSQIERILNHQQHLHFNVPYDDAEAERWGRYAVEKERDSLKEKYEDLQNKFKNFFDIPHQNELGTYCITAKNKWEIDKKHIEFAKENNYIIYTIWENEIISRSDNELITYINNLINN